MIENSRRWLRRNRSSFAFGAGILGVGYLASQYVAGKLSEARQRINDDRIARENLRRRFEQNQEDCRFTVLAILPTATENIVKALPVENTVAELQRQKAEKTAKSHSVNDVESTIAPSVSVIEDEDARGMKSLASNVDSHTDHGANNNLLVPAGRETHEKKTKIQLWNEMKIYSIARAFTLVYTICLLTLTTRIQLNLLGRRNYLASVVSLATPSQAEAQISLENNDEDNLEQAYGNDFEINRKYLSFSWWLLHRGCVDLMEKVVVAVDDVFSSINPRDDITLARLSELTLEVRRKIEGGTEEIRRSTKYLQYILPPPSQESVVLQKSGTEPSSLPSFTVPPALRRLIDETSDLVESPSFSTVLTGLLDSSFSLLIDVKLSLHAFKIPPVSSSPSRVVELISPETASTKVASCLAVFCRQAQVIGSGSNNEYLDILEAVKELEAFSAIVYSSNFSYESPDHTFVAHDNAAGGQKDSQLTAPAIDQNSDAGGSISQQFNNAWERALNLSNESLGSDQNRSVAKP